MAALIAGWAAGYAMAILSTVALTFLAMRASEHSFVRERLGEGTPMVLLAVPISLGTTLLWTMFGLGLGSVYVLGELGERGGALGSPSAPFLAGVAVVALLPLPLLVLLWQRYWWLWCGMSCAFAGLFGWLMPLLAER